MAGLDEFGEIARLWRPLAAGAPEALGLADDAAVIGPQACDLVVTTDTLVEGVHFLSHDPLEDVAAKLLAVNLSDLAAKAAEPYGWLFTVAWPAGIDAAARARFAAALGVEQARWGLKLFGGDTVATPGPLTLGATLFGRCSPGAMVRRAGARPGDVLLVSGAIGDAGLGLAALTGALALPEADAAGVIARYRRPEPRLGLRDALRAHAAAAAGRLRRAPGRRRPRGGGQRLRRGGGARPAAALPRRRSLAGRRARPSRGDRLAGVGGRRLRGGLRRPARGRLPPAGGGGRVRASARRHRPLHRRRGRGRDVGGACDAEGPDGLVARPVATRCLGGAR